MFGTFSIVAHDPTTDDLGVAVESKHFIVGVIVPWARAGVGAIATQAASNVTYGERGLDMLAKGQSPEDVVKALTEADPDRDTRQLGVIDAKGRATAFTGKKTNPWAGHRVGVNYAVQGNIIASEQVLTDMAKAFETTQGSLADKLMAALEAGQAAGGDRRGQQSAALLVVRKGGGIGGYNDRYVDLRVDDHTEPIKELRRIYEVWKAWRRVK
jgi:uncharacterized Ntn-hydrolase superfamily protein